MHPVAAAGFASAADVYDRARPSYPEEAVAWMAQRCELGEGKTVVDVGAGTGKLTRLLPTTRAHVIAVEPVAEMRAKLTGVQALDGTAEEIPLPDGSADVITVAQAFHWFDHERALPELHRVLKPGGTFAATVPSEWPEKINWRLSDEYHAPKSVGGHVRIYSSTELKAKLRSAGLDVTGDHHAHALHSPYWWLKCAVGPRRTDSRAVNSYQRLLEWEIVEQPRSMRVVERALSPVLGKSYVIYARKAVNGVRASAHARTDEARLVGGA